MNRATAQLSFLPSDAPAASARGVRGRGATPIYRWTYEAAQPNPAGRRRLVFKFRPLKRHSAERLATVTQLLCFYFDRIGGVELADDAVVRGWADYLRFDFAAQQADIIGMFDGAAWRAHVARFVAAGVTPECELLAPAGAFDNILTPREMLWSIGGKAESLADPDPAERKAKRKFVTTADGFLRGASAWLGKSAAYQEHQRRQREIAERDRLAERLYGRGGAASQLAASAAVTPPRETREQAAQRRQAYWLALTDEQRRQARAAVRGTFVQLCENAGTRPDDPKNDAWHDDIAINWAILRWPPKDGP